MKRRIDLAVVLALALSLVLLTVASAHAKLVSSDPAADAKLDKAPSKVTLVFSEEISEQESDSNFTVTDAGGATVGSGKLDTSDLDHKTLSGALKDGLGDGIYTVKWNALTPDDNGHSEGSFTFGVNQDPGAQPTAAPHDEEAQPTAAPTGAAQPTAAAAEHDHDAAGGGAPSKLPKTGASGPSQSLYVLIGAVALLAVGMALRRGKRDVHH